MKNTFDYKLPDSIKKELIKEGIDVSKIKLCISVEVDKQNHLWYGGDVIKFDYKDAIIYIAAIGDVIVNFMNKNNGDLLFHVKDKYNRACIYEDLSYYVKNDTELDKILQNEHPEYEFDGFDYFTARDEIYDLLI